jgi:enterochelin esterase-like enzyme
MNRTFPLILIFTALTACAPLNTPEPTSATPTVPPPSATAPATVTPSATIRPAPTESSTPAAAECLSRPGRIEAHELEGTQYPIPFRFLVYLPPCYGEQTDQRYPTLYLLHGQNYDDDQWIRIGATDSADRLIAGGEVPPFMIVMPYDKYYFQPSADTFDEVLIYALVPWIDFHYRTLTGAKYRSIGGVSRGGGWAIYLGLKYWELFGAFGGHSPAIFISDRASLYNWTKDIPAESLPRIYIDISDNDQEFKTVTQFEGLLNEMGIPHEWHPNHGFHDEAYWSRHVDAYLRWYAAGWMMNP